MFTIKNSISIVGITLFGVIVSVVSSISLFWGFLPGFLYLVFVSFKNGASVNDLTNFATRGLLKTKDVMIILLLVGALLPVWKMSGTIDGMVTIILSYINVDYFYVSAFLSTLLVSMILGTCVGSLSVIGIPLIGAAFTIGVSPEITAGALVSGAFIGDRTSPFSSANQLLSSTLEIDRKSFQRSIMMSGIIGVILSFIFYIWFDQKVQMGTTIFIQEEMIRSYLFVLPVISLLILAVLNINIKTCFIVSIIIGLIVTITSVGVTDELFTIWNGTEELGGGVKNMIPLVAFIGLAGAYNGIVEELEIFQVFLTKWMDTKKDMYSMTWQTMIATFFISLLASNQTLPIILTGRTFMKDWERYQSKIKLARVMADSSMLFAGIIPWSVLAIMCSTILRIPLLEYLPFAIFLWILPLITLLISYIIGVLHARKEMKDYLNS